MHSKAKGKIKVPLPQSSVRIVGFTVKPRSIPNTVHCDNGLLQYEDEAEDGLELKIGDETHIEFTYTVTIKESDQLWATRLDHYLNYGDPKLQWEQLAIALAVFALVSFTFFVVLCSAVNRDD